MTPNYEKQLRFLTEKFPPLPHHFVDVDGGPEAVIEAYNKGESIPVYTGDSENSIWGSPEANWLLRAHHDSIHLKYGIPFTLIGEYIAAEVSSALAQYLRMDELALALRADIAGFSAYKAEHGVFAPQEFAKELVATITRTCLTEVGEKQMREGPRELDNPGI